MDSEMLEKIIARQGNEIFSFCLYLTREREEAEELYQEVFLWALERDKVDFSRNPKSYLLGVAVRLWQNKKRKIALRQQKTQQFLFPQAEEPDTADTPEEAVMRSFALSRVRRAVCELADHHRTAVILYYLCDCSVEQIAQILHLPGATVKSRLSRARKLLKKSLEDLL